MSSERAKLDDGMSRAIAEARISQEQGGIPIGAALVRGHHLLSGGHNRRIQDSSPTLHAEIDALESAGRQRSYADCVLYSTLMPCYLCAGAIVQFAIPTVVVGETRTFSGAQDWLRDRGVKVVVLDLDICFGMLQDFIAGHPEIWLEDIGAVET